jgi:MFS family permease
LRRTLFGAGVAETLRAFGIADYRVLFTSNLLYYSAQFVFLASQQWVVVNLTDSRTQLGLVGLAQGLAILCVTPAAGVLTDRTAKRTLLLTTRVLLVTLTVLCSVLAAAHLLALPVVLVAAVALGSVIGMSQPATQTYVFDVVPRDRVANAIALNSANLAASQMIGPALAGALIAALGVAAGYFLSSAFYLAGAFALLLIPIPGRAVAASTAAWLESVLAGAKTAYQSAVARWIFFLLGSGLFGSAVQTLRPVFAKQIFDRGALGFGLLATAFGIGGVCGALVAANLAGRVRNKAVVMVSCGLFYGLSELLYGLAPTYETALVLEFCIGLAASAWSASTLPLLQMAVPAAFRGRVVSFYFAAQTISLMGQLASGASADLIGPRWTMVAFAAAIFLMNAIAIGRGTLIRRSAEVEFV